MMAHLIAYILSAILGIIGIMCFLSFIFGKSKGQELVAVISSAFFLLAAYGCARLAGI